MAPLTCVAADPLACAEEAEAAFGLDGKDTRTARSPSAFPSDDSYDSDTECDGCELTDLPLGPSEQAACLEAARRAEQDVLVDPTYLCRQPAVSAAVRTALVEWLMMVRTACVSRTPCDPGAAVRRETGGPLTRARRQASRRHRFSFRTVALAVSLLDRFLSRYAVQVRTRGSE
jgi:hypothetical protein